jgi:hypothetical protein
LRRGKQRHKQVLGTNKGRTIRRRSRLRIKNGLPETRRPSRATEDAAQMLATNQLSVQRTTDSMSNTVKVDAKFYKDGTCVASDASERNCEVLDANVEVCHPPGFMLHKEEHL